MDQTTWTLSLSRWRLAEPGRLTLQRLALDQVQVVRLGQDARLEAPDQPLQVAIVHVEVQLGERHSVERRLGEPSGWLTRCSS